VASSFVDGCESGLRSKVDGNVSPCTYSGGGCSQPVDNYKVVIRQGCMVIGQGFRRPSYIRRAPRWYDGAARLVDLGGTFDLHLPIESNQEILAEDWLLVRDDLRRALSAIQEDSTAIASDR
jgi:hypothetical protein